MDELWSTPAIRQAHARGDAGMIVRLTRQARRLTLTQLGALSGYSASQVSRYERGRAPLTDVLVLRRFADALQIPPYLLGLAPPAAAPQQGAAVGLLWRDVVSGRAVTIRCGDASC